MSLLKIKPFSIDLTDTFTFANANVTGNIISGNANLGNLTTSNYFVGNGSLLTSITGSNVSGQVGNALVAGTVYGAAQGNITSVGTLTGLISGGVVNFATSSNVNLGAVANVHITGGTAGYFLQTDGSGGLSWSAAAAGTGNANIAGSNTQIFFNDAGSSTLGAKSTFTFDKTTDTLNVTNITANGAGITYIAGANISGNVSFAVQAHYANIANSVAGANVSGTVAQATYAGTANSVAGANVSGTVAQATYAGTANSVAGANVSGEVAYAATANAVAGANVSGTVAQATYAGTANSVAGANVSGEVTYAATANAVAGANVSGTVAQATYAGTANSVAGANVSGTVAQATYAGTANSVSWSNVSSTPTTLGGYGITDSYSNTNAGAYLSSYSGDLSGANLTITGNLVIGGTTTTVNSTVTSVVDPIFELGGGANGAALANDDGKDRGTLLHYYSGGVKDAFMGWDSSNAEFGFGSAVSVSGEVVTFTTYGNLRAGYFIGNGSQLTSITGTNISGNVPSAVQSHYANIANSVAGSNVSGEVTYAATANSVAGANVSGTVAQATYAGTANSVAGANVSGQVGNALVAGTVYTAAQPNITSTGTLTSLTVSGTTNLGAVGNITITGGGANYFLKTNGSGVLSWSALPSTTISVDTHTGDGSWTMKTLSSTPLNINYTIVAIGGVFQPREAYDVTGTVITFDDPPPNGAIVEITIINGGTAGSAGYVYQGINSSTTAIAGVRYLIDTTAAVTLTLPASASLGDEVGVIDATGGAGTNNITVARNSGNIEGSASNMTVNTNRAAFTLVYYNATQGWVKTQK